MSDDFLLPAADHQGSSMFEGVPSLCTRLEDGIFPVFLPLAFSSARGRLPLRLRHADPSQSAKGERHLVICNTSDEAANLLHD